MTVRIANCHQWSIQRISFLHKTIGSSIIVNKGNKSLIISPTMFYTFSHFKRHYLYFILHFMFTSNDTFFKNKYNPIIFIIIISDA